MPLQEDVAKLYLLDKFSDIRFQLAEGSPIPAHRILCCARCEVLGAMLGGPFQEGQAQTVTISDVDRTAFLEMLRFLYTDKAQLSASIVVKVAVLADKFILPELSKQCLEFFDLTGSSPANFWPGLSYAAKFNHEQILASCIQLLRGPVFCEALLQDSPGGELSMEGLKLFVDKLVCKDEVKVFSFCVRWADAVNKDRREALQDILPLVRLPSLSWEELATTVANSGVLSESEQLSVFKQKATEGTHRSLFQGQPRAQPFVYHHDFDKNGIIYWLGTQKGKKDFTNPQNSGMVEISASHGVFSSCQLAAVVSFESSYTRLADADNYAWIAIHLKGLGNDLLQVSKYTLRHGRDNANYALRSWVFEGSEDGVQWTVLRGHYDDAALNSSFATASWDVLSDKLVRHVRVRMTGRTSSGGFILHLAGLEIYGLLAPQSSNAH